MACLIHLQVNDQISSRGGDRASVILVLTDGQLGDFQSSQQQVRPSTAHMICMHKTWQSRLHVALYCMNKTMNTTCIVVTGYIVSFLCRLT